MGRREQTQRVMSGTKGAWSSSVSATDTTTAITGPGTKINEDESGEFSPYSDRTYFPSKQGRRQKIF